MHALDEKYAGIVFAKTDKGREEMAKRTYGLNPMQRRVLIIIDGIKKFDAIIDMIPAVIPAGEMGKIFTVLLGQGFIVAVADTAAGTAMTSSTQRPQSAAVLQMPSPAAKRAMGQVKPVQEDDLTQDPTVIRLIKDFMTTTSQTYLGLLGADVIQRIERAKTAEQLLSVLGYWHMALQDSREGHRFAVPYMEQVRNALYGKGQFMLSRGPEEGSAAVS